MLQNNHGVMRNWTFVNGGAPARRDGILEDWLGRENCQFEQVARWRRGNKKEMLGLSTK